MNPNHTAYHNELRREAHAFYAKIWGANWIHEQLPERRPTPFPPFVGRTDEQLRAEQDARKEADERWWHEPLSP